MRRIGRGLIGFLAGYVVYLVLIEIFLAVVSALGGGHPDTLPPLFWPFAAPYLVRPSEWQLRPRFENVCSLVGGLIVLMVAIWVYRALDPRRNKSEDEGQC